MRKIVKLMGFVIAASVMAAVWSSSALAEFKLTEIKCEASTVSVLCDSTAASGKELFELTGREKFSVKGGESEFKVESLGLTLLAKKVKGENSEATQENPLVTDWLWRFVLLFEEVAVVGSLEAKCEVNTPVKTTELTGEEVEDGFLSVKPTTGTAFATLAFKSKTGQTCPATIIGENPVTGSLACPVSEGGVDLVIHKLTCSTVEAEKERQLLKFGGGAVLIAGTLEDESELKLFISTQLA